MGESRIKGGEMRKKVKKHYILVHNGHLFPLKPWKDYYSDLMILEIDRKNYLREKERII